MKDEFTITEDSIRSDAEAMLGSNDDEGDPTTDGFQSLFKIQTATRWLADSSQRPAPKMLFGEFWFEGEICILFADTNVGKSILAVQITDSIACGRQIDGIPTEAEGQKAIYFDFELSDKQFEGRYSEKAAGANYYSNAYEFNSNFYRGEIDPDADIDHGFESFEEYLNHSLKHAIETSGSKILIIDNLTYLKNETERAKDALPLMKYLKSLKSKYGLSILALAHTPKRDLSKPITRNDLQGSKMLINFCDSSFAIGESAKDKGLRYLKQIKVRNAEPR
ncbi:MAG: AAA family ATPase [Pyrinomonadaceae bacterium]